MAKMRLASLSRVTSMQALTGEDTPDVLSRLEGAIEQVRTELSRNDVEKPLAHGGEIDLLRDQLHTFLDLMTQRSLFIGNVDTTVRRIDEAASTTLGIERVSTWFLDPARTKITCIDLFERKSRKHSQGTELFAKDFGPYFRALEGERTIAAHDARKDPRTSCFAESYLAPLGITSMLDVPIWVGQRMVGVICHEHIGARRTWTKDDETFGYLMASFVALALERNGKSRELVGATSQSP